MKMIPLEKQSKRNQREFFSKKRNSWNGISPVTRVAPDKTKYSRKRQKAEDRRSLRG